MSKPQKKKNEVARPVMTGLERLGLRVSSMINHPTAQLQCWVTVHRLDDDGDREWEEVMGLLSETDDLEMTFNDEDDSVTLKWKRAAEDDPRVEAGDFEVAEEAAPF